MLIQYIDQSPRVTQSLLMKDSVDHIFIPATLKTKNRPYDDKWLTAIHQDQHDSKE